MKIIYNPIYDSGCYSGLCNQMGTAYMGTLGLLEELQLRAGLTHASVSACDRLSDYRKAIDNCIAQLSDYKNAYNADPNGVAATMLSWRDALIMAGWSKSKLGKPKFDELALIDSFFTTKGAADYWMELTKADFNFIQSTEIIVTCNKTVLPKLIVDTLDRCNSVSNCTVTFMPIVSEASNKGNALYEFQDLINGNKTQNINVFDSSFKIIKVNQTEDAYKWLVDNYSSLNINSTVIVNADNTKLNNLLLSTNHPLLRSAGHSSESPEIQIFKTVYQLMVNPKDIYLIMDFLGTTNPIAATESFQLRNILRDKGGFGKNWNDFISKLSVSAIDAYNAYNTYLEPLLSASKSDGNFYIKVTNEYIKWTENMAKHAGLTVTCRLQYQHLLDMFTKMKDLLTAGTTPQDLLLLIEQVYSPMDVNIGQQLGGLSSVPNVCCIASDPDTLIWLDCSAEKDSLHYDYDFLSTSDASLLKIKVPSKGQILSAHINGIKQVLGAVKKNIKIFLPRKEGNSLFTDHPFYSEVKKSIKASIGVWHPSTTSQNIISFAPKSDITVNAADLKSRLTAYMSRTSSYSALENLIQKPFSFVMNYLLDIHPVEDKISDSTLPGNVAHYVVELLIKQSGTQCPNGLSNFKSSFSNPAVYDKIVDQAMREKGMLYDQSVLVLDKHVFLLKLRRSIEALIKVMDDNRLIPWESETDYPKNTTYPIAGFNLTAHIDMLARKVDDNGNLTDDYWIFDFKWSNNTKYETALKSNTSLQLLLYAEAANMDVHIVGKGYFLFPKCRFYTADSMPSSNEVVSVSLDNKAVNNLLMAASEVLEERVRELSQGQIEEGELMKIDMLPSSCLSEDAQKLLDLNSKKKNSDYPVIASPKKANDYSISGTSYPILKERLK